MRLCQFLLLLSLVASVGLLANCTRNSEGVKIKKKTTNPSDDGYEEDNDDSGFTDGSATPTPTPQSGGSGGGFPGGRAPGGGITPPGGGAPPSGSRPTPTPTPRPSPTRPTPTPRPGVRPPNAAPTSPSGSTNLKIRVEIDEGRRRAGSNIQWDGKSDHDQTGLFQISDRPVFIDQDN